MHAFRYFLTYIFGGTYAFCLKCERYHVRVKPDARTVDEGGWT